MYGNTNGIILCFLSVNDDDLAVTGTEFSRQTQLSYTYKELFFWATETYTNNVSGYAAAGSIWVQLVKQELIEEKKF